MRLLIAFLVLPTVLHAAEPLRYNRDVRPILSDNCFACHGPDASTRKARLRLDDRDAALEKDAFTPGKAAASELIDRIRREADDPGLMPPPESHKKLTEEQKRILERWIDEGAVYEPHWAYVPLVKPPVPQVSAIEFRLHSPIDSFIAAELARKKLTQSPEAERRVVVRRLYLDLLGLPPTPEQAAAFVNDARPDAYERLVDALLADSAFGERMAVPWLDQVRFADTVGYHGDQNQRIFPYRDYVINAFNANKPFDQFAIEQLAGDLLPNPTTEQRVATGFNRLNMMTREGGAQPKEYIAKYQADRVRTVSLAFLGSTMGCAECHDHKYDPFTAKDFYAMSAFFADVRQWGVYHDYTYTPNPDLKGWSNDHPFPPEIAVESDYLKKQLLETYQTFCAAVHDEAVFFAQGSKKLAAQRWDKAAAAFIKKHPDRWQVLRPVSGDDRIETDGRVVFTGPVAKGDKPTLAFKPGAGWVASLRLEILPHEAHGNRLARNKAASVTVQLTASRKTPGGKIEKLPLFYGISDKAQLYRYASTEPVLNLARGWRTLPDQPDQPHAAVFALDQPIELDDEDELLVTLNSETIGCVRISVSPFPIDDLDAVAARLRKLGFDVPENVAAHGLARLVLGTTLHKKLHEELKPLRRVMFEQKDGKAWTQITVAQKPIVTRILPRGNWMDETAPEVLPAVPGFLNGPASTDGYRLNRLDLAQWTVAKNNPLTARVFVNRTWAMLIGTGLCASIEDVGAQGEWPSHPELLDWLACEFQQDWNVKRLVKQIAMSHTYRQQSAARPEALAVDPGNRLLAYLPPRRLEAEFVRDNALAIAGLLNRDLGGPSAKPYQPDGYYANLQFPDRVYRHDTGRRQYRRGLYIHWQRTFLHPMLANFDAPSREECTAQRVAANTPQQALTLLNDPTFVEAARVLAAKVYAARETDEQRLDDLFERVLARPPRQAEAEPLLRFLAQQRSHYADKPEEAKKLLSVGLAPAPAATPDLAAWASLCRVLLNLHESITRY